MLLSESAKRTSDCAFSVMSPVNVAPEALTKPKLVDAVPRVINPSFAAFLIFSVAGVVLVSRNTM